VEAGGPLLIGTDGTPRRWSTAAPVEIHPEPGPFGGILTPRRLLEHAIVQWNSVGTASLRIEIGEPLADDLEDLDAEDFNDLITRNDGTNPIIFDSDGSIFDSLFGPGSNVLAIAGPSLLSRSGNEILKGYALFNGTDATDGTFETLKAVVTHEVGHFLNLDHSQVNGHVIGRPVPGVFGTPGEEHVTTMFPILIRSTLNPHPMSDLHKDDRVALSVLYPAASLSLRSSITGMVLEPDGVTPLQGVNVVARNLASPFTDAVSYVSGQRFRPGETTAAPASLAGAYELRGLDAERSYIVSIEEIHEDFVAGSGLGPLDPPRDLDTTEPAAFLEHYSGPSEAGTDPPDDPLDAAEFVLAGGETRRADIIWNGVDPRVTSIEPASGSFLESHPVVVHGFNLDDPLAVRLEGPATIVLGSLMTIDGNAIAGVVPAGSLPGAYQPVVVTQRGRSDPGADDVTFRVTEPPPVVFSTSPDVVENNQDRLVSVIGENLLGAQVAELSAPGLPVVELAIFSRPAANRIVVDVPAGILPGAYRVRVTNTTATSGESAELLFVVELPPVLSGETEPPSGKNTKTVDITVFGENLAGTTSVELLLGDDVVTPLVVVSTSLGEVVATVPVGLEPGTYLVRLTNTNASATGPASFEVTKGGGGGGGGCGVVPPGGSGSLTDLPFLLLLATGIIALRWLRRLPAGTGSVALGRA
jgi:hypothetical protein